ncbi:Membrane-bound lytic murein transglycosylase F [BD1-7 clade bacterium]|uniref:Membrane-bound lytic murein transglycosylase F n=1 Tax=BD1-7 clade bacterium TaxID=2029982 RepID=A0A5S9N026_9GAMM|nr:Membrane-bound lytic murein transglycosylase F [BD1-7 clade bacterium]
MHTRLNYILRRICALTLMTILMVTALVSGCSENEQIPADAANASSSGLPAPTEIPTLTAITVISETTYFEGPKGADGFEYTLLEKFSREHGYDLNLIIADDEVDLYDAMMKGQADIALPGLPIPFSRQNDVLPVAHIFDVTTQLIYRRGSSRPRAFDDLIGTKIVVRDTEQYRQKYAFLKEHYPELNWQFVDKPFEELVKQVHDGAIDHTLVDSHHYLGLRAIYTRTKVAFDIYYPESLSWLIPPTHDEKLAEDLDIFFEAIKSDGTLNHLNERFFGHADDANPIGSLTFFRRVERRLPRYQDLIEQIATEHSMDWRLLAAVAYQESHWNPRARSQTGVRGMMMLTLGTARDLGIENRLDVASSLRGGATYFNKMRKRLPNTIKEPDRSWLALAAYNVGFGHLIDARTITEFHGADPNRWADVKRYLPLLEKKQWHRFTRHGHARGREPVRYVQNIRHFSDLLEWRFPYSDAEQAAFRQNLDKNRVNERSINIESYEDSVIQKAESEEPVVEKTADNKLTLNIRAPNTLKAA